MKKIVLFVLMIFCITDVYALESNSKYMVNQPIMYETTESIIEEYEIIKDGKNIKGINLTYIIPEEFQGNFIQISPAIFDKIAYATNTEKDYTMPGDKYQINLKIINNSNYDYTYLEDSFVLSTEDLTKYEEMGYLKKSGDAIGFNNKPVYTDFETYRTGNTSLVELYGYSKTSQLTDNDLLDSNLDLKLKELNYKGIEDINKYYLDFYNKKYELNVSRLEDFPHNVILEIFDGNRFNIKETNKELVELSYNWFYNKLLSFTFNNEQLQSNYDEISEQYSIGNYMRKVANNNFKELDLKSKEAKEINNMSLNINGKYTVNTFMIYNFSGYMGFELQKVQEASIEIPPKTGNYKNTYIGIILIIGMLITKKALTN